MAESDSDSILILWTSGDREVALNMVLMYALNSRLKDWWENVTLLVWGHSSKLLAEDPELQQMVEEIRLAGARTIACRKCAENYEIVDRLNELNLEVFYVGEFLTEWIKSGKPILTL